MGLVVLALLGAGFWYFSANSGVGNYSTVDTTTPATTTEGDEEYTIVIEDFAHSPGTAYVEAGAVVRIINNDATGHSVTSDDGLTFDTGIISQGEVATFIAPPTPGEYPYHCTPHPNMKGVLVVQ